MIMNLLNYDIIENILNILEKDIENKIILTENKIKKVQDILSPLVIDNNNILYENVYYCMQNYLFSNLYENIILINDPYIYGSGEIYTSKVLKNPTYYDILKEASKSVKETDDYCHIYMKKLEKINNYDKQTNINYYEIILDS
jgi:hypothetical protein